MDSDNGRGPRRRPVSNDQGTTMGFETEVSSLNSTQNVPSLKLINFDKMRF